MNEQDTDRAGGGALEDFESINGMMSKAEAEMLLRAQEEEENRMRAEKKKARSQNRPTVIRDW